MAKKTKLELKKKNNKGGSENTLYVSKDWKNEKDYDYTKDHTPELWAWEFLRRNPEYRKDWEKTLALWENAIDDKPNLWAQLFNVDCSKENYQTRTLPFKGARDKWGLFLPEIINPSIDKPLVEWPFSFFHTYGYYYGKDDLDNFPDLKSTEVLAVFDMAKPIQQQLEYFKELLEEDQNYLLAYTELNIPEVKNKPGYRKDYIRILDALEVNAETKEIASVIFPSEENSKPEYHGNRMVRDSLVAAKKFRDGMYRNFLQKPSEWKKI